MAVVFPRKNIACEYWSKCKILTLEHVSKWVCPSLQAQWHSMMGHSLTFYCCDSIRFSWLLTMGKEQSLRTVHLLWLFFNVQQYQACQKEDVCHDFMLMCMLNLQNIPNRLVQDPRFNPELYFYLCLLLLLACA